MAKKSTPGARVAMVLKKDWSVGLTIDPAPHADADLHPDTIGAQNYLDSAATSVQNALSAASRQRAVRLAFEGKAQTGRYSGADQDLLRSALLFAGAGCDSALKRLLRDSLSSVVHVSENAEVRLRSFTENHIVPGDASVDRKALARLFLSDRPRDALVESYTDFLTGGSLQSAERMKEVALALGVDDSTFLRRMDAKTSLLREMFAARNEIVHQLDLRDPDTTSRGANAHRRKTRTINDVTGWSAEALSTCQYIVNAVTDLLNSQP